MQEIWATWGVDLHVEVGGFRVRAGLESALREAVAGGRLPAGLRLPSSRNLARDLGIARNTVVEVYDQLVSEGWLVARRGSGTTVAQCSSQQDLVRATPAPPTRQHAYDLRPGTPDLSGFPRAQWLAAARMAVSAASPDAFGYGDPRGRSELRRALAGYLARARGVRTDPDRIVVCSGFTQAFSLLCHVLCARAPTKAPTLAMEGYGLPHLTRTAADTGLRVQALDVDSHGATLDDLGDADAVLLTPAHQFPLGMPLHPLRRARFLEWAAAGDALIIEDDYDGEFRYDRQPVGALQARAPDRVAYVGTASKSLAPGLRLGWLVPPARTLGRVLDAMGPAERNADTLAQLTLAEFIASGRYDRHIRRARTHYRRRRDSLIELVRRQTPDISVTGIAAGLHALLQLPPGRSEAAVVARAAKIGLAVAGLNEYRLAEAPRHQPALVIGYGTPPEHSVTNAFARLVQALSTDPAPGPRGRPERSTTREARSTINP